MTQNRRIILNTLATYTQSLVRILAGFFSVRWVLNALGQSDFGLYCVVGSLITFIVFFNGILSGSNARYYAYSIGEGQNKSREEALDDLKRWFNTALSVHTVVPMALLLVGYPIAEYAIRHWINIDPNRIEACVWVFRIACVTAFVGMSSVPYLSMYTAKQYIAVRAGFGMAGTVLNLIFAFMLSYLSGDKLIWYAFLMMIINAGLPLVQVVLAIKAFPECRLQISYWRDWGRLRSLLSYAGWVAFGGAGGYLIGSQGSVFVTNSFFGTVINASYGIGAELSAHTQSLSSSLLGALSPVVTTSEGSGNRERAIRLARRTGKFGVFLVLLFAIPMILEMRTLLLLWLGRIPDYVVPICILTLTAAIIEKFTIGYQMAISATGKIALWQLTGGVLNVLIFPTAWLFAALGMGPLSASVACVCCPCCTFFTHLWFARRLLGVSMTEFIIHVFLPVVLTAAITFLFGGIPILLLPSVWWRIPITTMVCLLTVFPIGWFCILDAVERDYFKTKGLIVIRKFKSYRIEDSSIKKDVGEKW